MQGLFFEILYLNCFSNLAGAQAAIAHIGLTAGFAVLNAQLFDIGHPARFGQIVGMAHFIAG